MDANTSEADKGFMEDLIKNAWYPPLFGFIPDSTNVSTQVAAVSNIYDQYYDVLTYGDVNPDEYLPQFLTELEDRQASTTSSLSTRLRLTLGWKPSSNLFTICLEKGETSKGFRPFLYCNGSVRLFKKVESLYALYFFESEWCFF